MEKHPLLCALVSSSQLLFLVYFRTSSTPFFHNTFLDPPPPRNNNKIYRAGFIANQLVKELGNSAGEGFQELHYVKSAQEGNRTLYQRKSAEVRQILVQYDPQLKCSSLDECYMNLQPYVQLRYGLRVDADNRKNKNKQSRTGLSHEEIQHYWASQKEKEENNNNNTDDETNTNSNERNTNVEDDDNNDESDSSDSDEDISNTDPTTRTINPMIEYDQRVQEIVHEVSTSIYYVY